jgi:ribosome modulation factor
MAVGHGGFLNARPEQQWSASGSPGKTGSLPSLPSQHSSPYHAPMTSTGDPSVVVRAAIRVGQALGDWRRRRLAAAQDAYIDMWKSAWAEGCHAGWQGAVKDDVPYRAGPQRDAWSAGWNWAGTHPSRAPGASISIPERRGTSPARPRVLRAASGGAIGVAFFAAARFLWRSRRPSDKSGAGFDASHGNGSQPSH